MTVFVGVDHGKNGAIVAIDDTGKSILRKIKTPMITSGKGKDEYDLPAMAELLKEFQALWVGGVHVTFEKLHAMPFKMGGSQANFQRGLSFGLWSAYLTMLGIPRTVVAPRTWQKAMLADMNVEDTKQASVLAAQRLWPTEDWRRTERCKNLDDGFTDAALLAEYGRRVNLGIYVQQSA